MTYAHLSERYKMSLREFRAAIRVASTVFAWVRLTEHDGAYVKVTKQNMLLNLPTGKGSEERVYCAVMRWDDEDNGDLYVG